MSTYTFNTESLHYNVVEIKGEKHYYVTGYISTSDKDLYNDVVTEKAMNKMLEQLQRKSIKLDYDHEVWRTNDDKSPANIIPVGKIIEAKIDTKGLWVKAEMNDASPKFEALWKSIKKGFVDAFSIAFQPIKTTMKAVGDSKVRLIEDLELLNVALTGVPVNQGARITDVMMKAIIDTKKLEETKMETDTEIKSLQEKLALLEKENISLKAEKEEKEKKEKEDDEEDEKKKKSEKEESDKKDAEMKSMIAQLKSEIETLKKEPIMKSIQETPPMPQAPVMKSVLSLIK